MKTPQIQPTPHRGLPAALGITLALAASLTLTHAADRTWNGAGDGVTMNSGDNWVGGIAPVANDSLFFDGTTGLAPNNNYPADTDFAGITFNAGAGAFVISGLEIDLAVGAGVTNNSANPQTISANLDNNGANKFHNAAAADLIYTGQVKGNRINKEGSFAIWLQGTLDNSNLGLNLTNGTVILAKSVGSNVRALGGDILVSTNGTLRINGPSTDQIQFARRITMNGAFLQVANTNGLVSTSFEEFGTLSGANVSSIAENGLADSTNSLTLGGGNGRRGIYGGIIRDGAGVLNLRLTRHDNNQVFNGTHSYTGTTEVQNNSGVGITRMILNGTHVGGGNYTISSSQAAFANGAALGGTGIVSAAVANFNAASFLSPGGALSADGEPATFSETTGILTISNAVNLNAATATLDVQLNGTTAGSGYDQAVIAGSGTFLNNNANLKLALGFTPAAGDKFTIVQVQGTDSASNVGIFGTLNGVVTDLSQGATIVDPGTGKQFRISYRAEGSTFDAGDGLGNDIMLEAVAAAGTDLTWRGDVNNAWDITTTANWRTTGGVSSTFTNGDFVTFNDSGSNNLPLDLTTDVTPAQFLFNATKDYVLAGAGKLTGTVILTKTNTGTLTIVTDNNNLGSTIIQQGTVRVGTNGTTGTISGSVAVNAGGTFVHSRADDVTLTTALTGAGSFLHTGDGALILGGNSTFSGRTTNNGGLLQLGTGLDAANGSIGGDVHVSGTNVLRYLYAGNVTIGNTKSGNGTVIYEAATGNREFLLPPNVVNTNFSGSNFIAAGVRLKDTNPNPGYSLGNGGSVTVADFGQVYLETSPIPHPQDFFLQGNGWSGDATPLGALRIYQATISGPVHLLADTRIGGSINGGTIIGKIDGAFQLEVLATATNFVLALGPTNGLNTYGSTLVTSGSIRALNSGGISSGPLTVDLIGVVHTFGNNVTVASLNNGINGGGAIYNLSTTTNGTLTVGTDGTSTSFDGVFANGASQPLGLTKVGAGTLTLSGVNANTGRVTVSGGTLALTGAGSFGNAAFISVGSGAFYDVSAAGGTLTLNSGQTLGGNGTVTGAVITSPGSTIAPGTSVGTLTVAGNVTLGGGMTMELNRSLSPNSDRLVTSGGTLTGGGSLTTTNIGPALQVNDTFQLFAAGVSGITAKLQTVDAVIGVTYTWQNDIASLGSIKVLSVTPIAPPTLDVGQSGNTLTFTWTGPFKLQAQTNSLAIGISNNWGNYPGGEISPVVVTINPSNPTVFFRLSLQ